MGVLGGGGCCFPDRGFATFSSFLFNGPTFFVHQGSLEREGTIFDEKLPSC